MNVVETNGLGKRYRGNWALHECTLAIPSGHVVALVGPNGAGKTTLLDSIVGLTSPTTGTIQLFEEFAPGSPDALERIAFVAQDAPLHSFISVKAMIGIASGLNRVFDEALVLARLNELKIPLSQKVGRLSGGQHAQLALTLALARHPQLLVLDEPLARLDPVARHDFMGSVMAVAEGGELSVVFSSHVVSELERVADHLIVLSNGRLQMAGNIDGLLAEHHVLFGPADDVERVSEQVAVVGSNIAGRRANLIVRAGKNDEIPDGWESDHVSLEELVLAYLREPSASIADKPFAFVVQGHLEGTK
jgi:ABC-2 type transport system ATP-binding protein